MKKIIGFQKLDSSKKRTLANDSFNRIIKRFGTQFDNQPDVYTAELQLLDPKTAKLINLSGRAATFGLVDKLIEEDDEGNYMQLKIDFFKYILSDKVRKVFQDYLRTEHMPVNEFPLFSFIELYEFAKTIEYIDGETDDSKALFVQYGFDDSQSVLRSYDHYVLLKDGVSLSDFDLTAFKKYVFPNLNGYRAMEFALQNNLEGKRDDLLIKCIQEENYISTLYILSKQLRPFLLQDLKNKLVNFVGKFSERLNSVNPSEKEVSENSSGVMNFFSCLFIDMPKDNIQNFLEDVSAVIVSLDGVGSFHRSLLLRALYELDCVSFTKESMPRQIDFVIDKLDGDSLKNALICLYTKRNFEVSTEFLSKQRKLIFEKFDCPGVQPELLAPLYSE
ncbi:hypothetical protein HOG98_01870, partial [bacterium]|nr:hypothetical protein [bacterium]